MNKIVLSLDVMNVGNLFNSKWGVEKNMNGCNDGKVLKVNKIVDGVPYFSMFKDKTTGAAPTSTWSFDRNYDQCWKLQFGVKYVFN